MSNARFERVTAKTFTLENSVEEVVDITLSPNNEHPQRVGRLAYQFKGSYPSEVEIECGPDLVAKGNIISQIQQWGPRTKDGKNRNRLTVGIYADNAGGLSGVIDSSTNDPSGSAGQALAMPIVVNVGEAKGSYIVVFADGRVKMKHGSVEVEKTVEEWVAGK